MYQNLTPLRTPLFNQVLNFQAAKSDTLSGLSPLGNRGSGIRSARGRPDRREYCHVTTMPGDHNAFARPKGWP